LRRVDLSLAEAFGRRIKVVWGVVVRGAAVGGSELLHILLGLPKSDVFHDVEMLDDLME
jgi:hypothetical protein